MLKKSATLIRFPPRCGVVDAYLARRQFQKLFKFRRFMFGACAHPRKRVPRLGNNASVGAQPRHIFHRVVFTLRLYGTKTRENDFVASIGARVLENVFVADAGKIPTLIIF